MHYMMIYYRIFAAAVTVTGGGQCGGELTTSSGFLTSPGYPQSYPSGVTCVWTITAPVGSKLNLQFNSFDLESASNCQYDSVQVNECYINEHRALFVSGPIRNDTVLQLIESLILE